MEEKLLILKMLEEGKINSEEAIKLLEALEKSSAPQEGRKEITSKKLNETINEISKKAEKFAEKFGPDFISKVESVSNDFADAAVKFADKMVSYINSGIKNIENYDEITKSYAVPIENNDMRINFKTQNLKTFVNGTDKNEFTANLTLNLFDEEINIDEYIDLIADENSISFITRFPISIYGEINISVPNNINELQIETTNAKCMFSDIHASQLRIATTNGQVEINKCMIENLITNTNNGKITVNKTSAHSVQIETSNAGIEVTDSSFDMLKASTSNNYINLNNIVSLGSAEALYDAQTTNGRIMLTLPKSEEPAYKINARTSLGNINLTNLDSAFNIELNDDNTQSRAVITAKNYGEMDNKVLINAATTNSSISITKE